MRSGIDKAGIYLGRLEKEVILKGYRQGLFVKEASKVVPLRPGKLAETPFGQFVGKVFDFDDLLAINYYGLYKLSSGIIAKVESVSQLFNDIRSIMAPVVYFNSIKIEHVQQLTDKGMQLDFPIFKKDLVKLRWG